MLLVMWLLAFVVRSQRKSIQEELMDRTQAKSQLEEYLKTVTDPAQRAALEAALAAATTPAKGGGGPRGPVAHEQMLTAVREAGDEGLDARVLFEMFGWGAYNINIAMRKVIQEQEDRSKFVWLAFDGEDRTYTGALTGKECTYQHIVIVGEGEEVPEGWEGFVPSPTRKSGNRWLNENEEERCARTGEPTEAEKAAAEAAAKAAEGQSTKDQDDKAEQQKQDRDATEAETGQRPGLVPGGRRNRK